MLIRGGVEDNFHKESYVGKLLDVMEENQNADGPCRGCKHLKQIIFEGLEYDDVKLKNIVHNNFRGCNSRCIYCDQNVAKINEKYESLKIIKRLLEEGCIDTHFNIDFGGGEPTLLPNLKEYLEFGYAHGCRQLLNTSGILFHESIYEGLKQGNLTVQISPDAGTAETYKKIKRQNGFEQVWRNIGKYCDYADNVLIKYIVFSYNSSHQEIDAFITQCKRHGVKDIRVSAETRTAWKDTEKTGKVWEFGEAEIDGCAYLMYQCCVNDFLFRFMDGNVSEEKRKKVGRRFFEYYFKSYIKENQKENNVFVYGMGKNGVRLYHQMKELGIEIRSFVDCDVKKQKTGYDGKNCLSPEEINGEKDWIIISTESYHEIWGKLKQQGVKKIFASFAGLQT